ncbi:hypothetical protein L6R53_19360 [Myxococcota bacterium]|nr:hypothetical protein [Myxococcota bacterium]
MQLALWSVLLLGSTAHARCTLAALETTLVAGPSPRRTDRWTWRVEEGPADCVEVHLASPPGAPIEDVQVEVQRVDARAPRLEGSRRSAVATSADPGFGPSPGLVLHTPELRHGDLLLVEVERPWPLPPDGFTWRPGARGPLELATLRVEGAVAVRAEGLDLGPGEQERDGARTWLVEGIAAVPPEPLGLEPARIPGPAVVTLELALLLPERKPVRGLSDPRHGATRHSHHQVGGLPSRVAWPVDARDRSCTVDGAPCPEVGGMAWSLPAEGDATWTWTVPGAAASGELALAGEGRRGEVRLAVVAPGPVALDGASQRGLAPASPDAALAPTARWRLSRLGDLPILPDPVAAEQAAAWLAIRASIPEPALYEELRGRRQDPTVLVDLLALHHDRLRVGSLPGQAPLEPRRLLKVRRSGWGTPWELALVLTRQLQQLKLDARPFAARPAELGPGDPASLVGWPLALVRLRAGGQELWIDPTCPTCAPGELRPLFDGARLLSSTGEALPALPASTWRREVSPRDDGQELRVSLAGPLAVELRAELGAVPADERPAWLARRFGGAGARLVEHRGLAERGEGVDLRLWAPAGSDLPPPLPAASADGAPGLLLPAAGTWTERRVLPVAEGQADARWRAAEAEGLRWDRSVAVEPGLLVLDERLEIDARVLARPGAAAVLSRLHQEWGRPAAGSTPPAGSPPPAPGPPAGP